MCSSFVYAPSDETLFINIIVEKRPKSVVYFMDRYNQLSINYNNGHLNQYPSL